MREKLEFNTSGGKTKKVELEINYYVNNHCIYIGLMTGKGVNLESFADVTVNLDGKAPDYCGFCEYPLYLFNVDKLRELCPGGMLVYEQGIGKGNREKKEEKSKSR